MKNKKIKKEDEISKQINKLHSILDKNYFHISIYVTNENEIKWSVFYNNLDEEDYISNKNMPILSSRKNTMEDIYILKNIFEILKSEQRGLNCLEIFNDSFKIHSIAYEMKEEANLGMINIITIYAILNIFITSLEGNIVSKILNLIILVLVSLYFFRKQKKINNLADKQDSKVQEILLRNVIKRKGLKFVKELRYEMHRNELSKGKKYTKTTDSKNV